MTSILFRKEVESAVNLLQCWDACENVVAKMVCSEYPVAVCISASVKFEPLIFSHWNPSLCSEFRRCSWVYGDSEGSCRKVMCGTAQLRTFIRVGLGKAFQDLIISRGTLNLTIVLQNPSQHRIFAWCTISFHVVWFVPLKWDQIQGLGMAITHLKSGYPTLPMRREMMKVTCESHESHEIMRWFEMEPDDMMMTSNACNFGSSCQLAYLLAARPASLLPAWFVGAMWMSLHRLRCVALTGFILVGSTIATENTTTMVRISTRTLSVLQNASLHVLVLQLPINHSWDGHQTRETLPEFQP